MSKKDTFYKKWHEFWFDWHQVKAYYYGSKRHERAMNKHLNYIEAKEKFEADEAVQLTKNETDQEKVEVIEKIEDVEVKELKVEEEEKQETNMLPVNLEAER
ncbi:hypothetical protein [Pseudomonas sp. 2822-17]|uniref:hypothetical protein n=1 Tax=Pseudomonas sp. 2822-17 TaxID=1712678 RepID=UPI000C15A0BC|nr:hypothetical protein [Pseudomonas sp. 2822-17]PIB57797.1 hypothetical protein AOA60_20650 [Pseudomonas sp. 2822-17]